MKKVLKKSGCTFTIQETSRYNSILHNTVLDIDVEPGVEVVELSGFEGITIQHDTEKSFPDVKELVIREEVNSIRIPNSLFPNVKKITSYSGNYLTSDMLIEVIDELSSNCLLNTFCKEPDEVIDMKDVTNIESLAFTGCHSVNIKNETHVDMIRPDAFKDSAFEQLQPVGGVYMAGSMIFDIDENAECIVIPKKTSYFFLKDMRLNTFNERYHHVKKVVVKNVSAFFGDVTKASVISPEHLVIDDDTFINCDFLQSFISSSCDMKWIDVTRKNQEYMTYQGVLYFKTKNPVVIACPPCRSGKVKIKEGTKIISYRAFAYSNIEEVVIPDSVKEISECAFSACKKLKSVTIGRGIKSIPKKCFDSDRALNHVIIPKNVNTIHEWAFADCENLDDITLEDGVESIFHAAFSYTNIRSLHLPKSITYLSDFGPSNIRNITMASDEMPYNIVQAVIETVSNYTLVGISKEDMEPCVIQTPSKTIYFPKFMESKPYLELNKRVNDEHVFPKSMLQYTLKDFYMKARMALAEYKSLHDEQVEKFLTDNFSLIVKTMVEENKEDKVMEYLTLNLINDKETYDKVSQMIPDHMISAKAYLLGIGSELTENGKSLFEV